MKIRTLKYIIKEGALNVYKNKLMTLASVGIVGASLIIFGMFLLFILNINHNTRVLNQQAEMRIFCDYDISDDIINNIQKEIAGNPNVSECTKVTAEESFARLKESLGDDASILDGFDSSLAGASFIVKLKDPRKSADVIEQFKNITNVRKVTYFKDVVEVISKLTYWVNIISLFLIVILLIVSVFIIANTIKLTVFARRKEISIVKYIGATDWFIRWPFIVEGVLIGVIGAFISFILIRYTYGTVESRFNSDLARLSQNFISFIKVNQVSMKLFGAFILLGAGVGAAGSAISLRKYLRV